MDTGIESVSRTNDGTEGNVVGREAIPSASYSMTLGLRVA
jgi:hypothetical protein